MPQFLRPNSDIALGSWTTSPLFEKINEVASNDTPFIVSPQQTLTTMEVGMSAVNEPIAGTRTLRIRARKTNTQQRGLNWALKVNGTSIESGIIATDLSTTFTTYTITIANAISDYTLVSLAITATGATGGGGASRSDAEVSWVEFEVPDRIAVIIDESLLLDSDSDQNIGGIFQYTPFLSLDSDGDISNILSIIFGLLVNLETNVEDNYIATTTLNQSFVLSVDSLIVETNNATVVNQLSLTANGTDQYNTIINYLLNLNLTSENNLDGIGNISFFKEIILDSEVINNFSNNININKILEFTTNNTVENVSQLTINEFLNLISQNEIELLSRKEGTLIFKFKAKENDVLLFRFKGNEGQIFSIKFNIT